MKKYQFKIRELDIVRNVTYKRGQWSAVAKRQEKVRRRLASVLKSHGRDAALELWHSTLEEELARSGGSQKKGSNLTRAMRRRGGQTRGLVLRKSSKFQRDAQRKMVESRRKRSRKPQTEAAMNDALAKADENELQLFETYLRKRHDSERKRVYWTQKEPQTESELEWFVLDTYHFCNNFRCMDSTSRCFKAAVAACRDGFKLWCSCVLLAVLPSWAWYSDLVKAACGSLVFNPFGLKESTPTALAQVLQVLWTRM